MALNATIKRRLLGTLFLLAALGMLVAGETVWKDRLGTSVSVLYWLACFVFTMLAIITALRDVRALSEKAVKEQRGLLDTTLREIESDARRKLQGNGQAKKGPSS
jgi:hypothetical protein